ncbi:hypothetical protein [Streptomyces minutiscleroticus]|uniref:Uncharacterized protein n=1 Tax=Streptomyces minutiscleroticus TaxID=68238 RepID=A0A918P5B2_9ACTN|nr:hypothetical protein [Streptomyces minutiscleroticus]GGY19190.1 hypothetical protein GCM10010358_82660 [Streptomyces minutiscleroticus]
MRLRHVRAVAVGLGVVLALTGARHSGGGGCSGSSHSSGSSGGSHYDDDTDTDYGSGSHYRSGSDYDDDYDTGGTSDESPGSGGREALQDATVRLVKCVTGKTPYARVEVTNPNTRDGSFWADVAFRDGRKLVKQETWLVEVPAGEKLTTDIEMGVRSPAPAVDRCDVTPQAPAD